VFQRYDKDPQSSSFSSNGTFKECPMLENLSQDPHHPALVRFGDACPKWLHSTDDFAQGITRRDRAHALSHRYIELYERRRTHIVLDVDRKNAIFTAQDYNLPPPTLTVVNPDNSHAHLFYELNAPVSFGKQSKQHPQDYFHAVKHALTTKARADASYAHHIAKNPLHKAWQTYALDCVYDLGELAEHLKLERKAKIHHVAHKRNCTVFETVRHWAYANIHQNPSRSQEHWFAAIWEQCSIANQSFPAPLPDNEVKATARSIAKWTWKHQASIGVRVMGFGPISKALSEPERKAEQVRREIAGGLHTGETRQLLAEQRIQEALKPLAGQTLHAKYIRDYLRRNSKIRSDTIFQRFPLDSGVQLIA
jgi:hypothetical protein